MTDSDAPELRLAVPTLEPDDAFVDRLAALAARSAPPTPLAAARSAARGGWRVTVAAAGVAGVVGGGAWLAAAVTGSASPTPPPPAKHSHRGDDATTSPSTPSQRPTTPPSGAPTRGGEDASGSVSTDDDRADPEGPNGPGVDSHAVRDQGQHGPPGTPPGHTENHHGDQDAPDAQGDVDHRPDPGDGAGDVTADNATGGGDDATGGDHGPVEGGTDDQSAGG